MISLGKGEGEKRAGTWEWSQHVSEVLWDVFGCAGVTRMVATCAADKRYVERFPATLCKFIVK